MHTYHTPLDLVRSRHVESPVVCARPDRVAQASHWFQENFPGEVLYAVKANPSPWILDVLYANGTRFFDVASIPEIQLVRERCPEARMAFLHPVKSRESIRRAYYEFGVRIFALDCEAEMAKIVEETNHADDLILIVRLAVSNDVDELWPRRSGRAEGHYAAQRCCSEEEVKETSDADRVDLV